MTTKVYDADQVTVNFAGILMGGFADGEFVTVEPTTDNFTSVVGTDGEVSRSKTRDRRGMVTIKLMQTSSANARLSALAKLDKETPNGAGIGALYINDRQGGSLYEAAEAWIAGEPSVSFDRGATAREWKIECSELRRVDAGN